MTDRQLMGFLTIVEKKSFTAAAEAMYISQSALSQQIRHLERQLGFALFDRSTRQPTLTEAGRSFYERAREIQHLYDRAVAEGKQIQHLSQQHIKRLVIGCLDEQFILIWQDLLTTALPLAQSYAPCPVRYYSKESLYAAGRSADRRTAGKRGYPAVWAGLFALCPGNGAVYARRAALGPRAAGALGQAQGPRRGSAGDAGGFS